MSDVNIADFINDDVKEYSKYVLYNRAIPNLIDGLKPSQRKILWTAIKTATKNLKTASLTGNVISCLVGNTNLMLSGNQSLTIQEFAEKYADQPIEVLCVDESGKQVKGLAHSPILTKHTKKTIIITLEDNKSVECTSEHLIAVKNNGLVSWIEAGKLTGDEDIITI